LRDAAATCTCVDGSRTKRDPLLSEARGEPIVVAGHAVLDQIIDSPSQVGPRFALGGGLSYSCIALTSLGYSCAGITKVGTDFPSEYSTLLKERANFDVSQFIDPIRKTTSYLIDSTVEPRKLQLLSRCTSISRYDFEKRTSNRALLVNTVANEISLPLLDRISKDYEFVAVDSQGFVRRLSKFGDVSMRSGLDISSLSGVDLLKADRAELSAWTGSSDTDSSIRQISKFVEYILVPSGPGRIDLFNQGQIRFSLSPPRVTAKDTTGSGDILLASFFARYLETENFKEALSFSVAAASTAVLMHGIEKAILNSDKVNSVAKNLKVQSG
jgi:sugar/nucleoside kinase (ribokinase family)